MHHVLTDEGEEVLPEPGGPIRGTTARMSDMDRTNSSLRASAITRWKRHVHSSQGAVRTQRWHDVVGGTQCTRYITRSCTALCSCTRRCCRTSSTASRGDQAELRADYAVDGPIQPTRQRSGENTGSHKQLVDGECDHTVETRAAVFSSHIAQRRPYRASPSPCPHGDHPFHCVPSCGTDALRQPGAVQCYHKPTRRLRNGRPSHPTKKGRRHCSIGQEHQRRCGGRTAQAARGARLEPRTQCSPLRDGHRAQQSPEPQCAHVGIGRRRHPHRRRSSRRASGRTAKAPRTAGARAQAEWPRLRSGDQHGLPYLTPPPPRPAAPTGRGRGNKNTRGMKGSHD